MLIKVMDEYGCEPLWVRDEGDEVFAPRDPAELGLTPTLVARLAAWRQWYESMVNIADPDDSRPVAPSEDSALNAEGRRLAARVHAELPQAEVWFYLDPEPGASGDEES